MNKLVYALKNPAKIWPALLSRLYIRVDAVRERNLARTFTVRHSDGTRFTVRAVGAMSRFRATTFSDKEPETLAWIDTFAEGDRLLDIGANIGIYTLYAAKKGVDVIAVEPDCLNFALLNLNIEDNRLGGQVIAYPFSVHAESKISVLHVGELRWGGALSSFDRNQDWKGNAMPEAFAQGSYGITVDDLVAGTGFGPHHIKIDVDGNELLVLEGAETWLRNDGCRSVLVELFEQHPEYDRCMDIMRKANFELAEKSYSPMVESTIYQAKNHIFRKRSDA